VSPQAQDASSACRQGSRGGSGLARAQDVPHYIHAEHMYEAWNIKHKHLKWGVAITLFVSIPFGIPFFAVYWQQKKMAG